MASHRHAGPRVSHQSWTPPSPKSLLHAEETALQQQHLFSLAVRGLPRSAVETTTSLLQDVLSMPCFLGLHASIVSVRRHNFLGAPTSSSVVEVRFADLAAKMGAKRQSYRLRDSAWQHCSVDHFLTPEQLRQRAARWARCSAWAAAHGFRCIWGDVNPTRLLLVHSRGSQTPPPPPPPRSPLAC